jgi:hypothetical protein
MATAAAQLDKSVDTTLEQGFGTVTIRVVVLHKNMASAAKPGSAADAPVDAEPDEMLPELDKRPTSSFLEEPKRGRQVCVFLINGQRQHAWDNQFIVRDLEFKYLRARMLVIVDCDGLKPEAIADLMQGSRHQFYEGRVYSALEGRIIATLKGDPDLRRLEEEAEEDIASLQAGDEVVKAALDQLIEAHHNAASHTGHGHVEAGQESRDPGAAGSLTQTQGVVVHGEATEGEPATGPVLVLQPDLAAVRLKPNEERRLMVKTRPVDGWKSLESLSVTIDPPIKELQVTRSSQLEGEDVALKFDEPEDFDDDEYPIEAVLRATATFKGADDVRLLERRLVINRPTTRGPTTGKPLLDDPTLLKVTSRQPIKIVVGGPDVHVKLRWDGKDELATGSPPEWTLHATCEAPTVEPTFFLTRPVGGRFELLIQASAGLQPGEQLKFDVEAVGPGKTIATAFLADVVEPAGPRRLQDKVPGGGQRRPPYDLRYLKREDWADTNLTCFGEPWSAVEPGAFDPPSAKSPLTIFINQDTDLLVSYREALLAKKLAEATIHQRVNRYTAHVAFHLYQMYQKQRNASDTKDTAEGAPSEAGMRDEIQRVAHTLIRLMEVSQ